MANKTPNQTNEFNEDEIKKSARKNVRFLLLQQLKYLEDIINLSQNNHPSINPNLILNQVENYNLVSKIAQKYTNTHRTDTLANYMVERYYERYNNKLN